MKFMRVKGLDDEPGGVVGFTTAATILNAHSDAIETHAERLDYHRDQIDAHDERLSAIEAKLGLEVYAVAPQEDAGRDDE